MSKIGVGVVGLGNFGKFLIENFTKSSGFEVRAIADNSIQSVADAGEKFQIKRRYQGYELLLKDPMVDLVVIATPPFSHYPIAKSAIKCKKNVWLEKPPVLNTKQLDEIIKLAQKNEVRAFVDFEMRFSPIFTAIKAIVAKDIMGPTEHIRLENFASDERLGQKHWFWDKKMSGGIFIEHNIHFFDIFCQIFGEPKLEYAYSLERKKRVEDRILAGLIFPKGVWGVVWHSFTRTGVLESTITDIILARGNLKVEGWIPMRLSGRALLTQNQLVEIKKLIPTSALTINRKPPKSTFSGNWQVFTAKADVKIDWELSGSKGDNYSVLTQAVISDVERAIYDKKYNSKVNLSEAKIALKLAQQSNFIAKPLIVRSE